MQSKVNNKLTSNVQNSELIHKVNTGYVLSKIKDKLINELEHRESIECLHGLKYNEKHLPDYTDKAVQYLYLLRYFYAYSYEFFMIFNRMITLSRKYKVTFDNTINFLSIGCGAAYDYSVLKTIRDSIPELKSSIVYRGIDCVTWDKFISISDKDTFEFYHDDINNWMQNNQKLFLESDVIFFPKSITELSEDYFISLLNNFDKMHIDLQRSKDFVFIIGSFRNESIKDDRDHFCEYVKKFAEAFNYKIDYDGFRDGNNILTDKRIPNNDIKVGNTVYKYSEYDKAILHELTGLKNYCNKCVSGVCQCAVPNACDDAIVFKHPITNTSRIYYWIAYLHKKG